VDLDLRGIQPELDTLSLGVGKHVLQRAKTQAGTDGPVIVGQRTPNSAPKMA
jgi:hypothetical protein